jgi:hypothetical protein
MAVNWKHAADTLQIQGIDLKANFNSLSESQVGIVAEQAKKSGYRPPKNASAAPADMFYAAIQRKTKVRPNASVTARRNA